MLIITSISIETNELGVAQTDNNIKGKSSTSTKELGTKWIDSIM